MKRLVLILSVLYFIQPFSSAQTTMTADDILAKIDANMVFQTAYSEVTMTIHTGKRIVEKKLKSYTQGVEKSFIEFLSPARDRGTKMLKSDKVLKIYFPSAERVMRLSGHMLRQSMMGSDFSYEDMTESAEELKKDYEVELVEEEELDGAPCFVIELTSKVENKTYFFRKIWVDKDKFIGLKEEFYAKSRKLLKVLSVSNIQSFQNRYYPTRATMEDKLRKNSKTVMTLDKIEFNVSIPEDIFSERNLMRK